MQSPSHPIWAIIRLAICMTALCVILWINASHFDATEIKTLSTFFFVAAGAEALPALLRKSDS